MPYPKDHKARTRQTILACAHRLFGEHGFDGTSIEDIMQASKLTRGAFYAHFKSKAALYSEVMDKVAPADKEWLNNLLTNRLADAPASVKRWTFLATDTASAQPEVRAAYAESLMQLNEQLRSIVKPQGRDTDNVLLTCTALFVGVMTIAMSVDDEKFKVRLAAACQDHARELLNALPEANEPTFLWAISVP